MGREWRSAAGSASLTGVAPMAAGRAWGGLGAGPRMAKPMTAITAIPAIAASTGARVSMEGSFRSRNTPGRVVVEER